MRRVVFAARGGALVGLCVVAAGGCRAPAGATTFAVPEGRYAEAIDAARDVLRDYRFELDRVDAGAGVVTTRPKTTAGLASFWEPDQSTASDEWDDLTNRHARLVRISFEAEGGAGAESKDEPAGGGGQVMDPLEPEGAAAGGVRVPRAMAEAGRLPPDTRDTGPVVGVVEVDLLRWHRPNWKLETEAIFASSHSSDPELSQRTGAEHWSAIRRDEALATRLALEISQRLGNDR